MKREENHTVLISQRHSANVVCIKRKDTRMCSHAHELSEQPATFLLYCFWKCGLVETPCFWGDFDWCQPRATLILCRTVYTYRPAYLECPHILPDLLCINRMQPLIKLQRWRSKIPLWFISNSYCLCLSSLKTVSCWHYSQQFYIFINTFVTSDPSTMPLCLNVIQNDEALAINPFWPVFI